MEKYKLDVSWMVSAVVEVEANSLKEAIEIAKRDELPPTSDWNYVNDSFNVDTEYYRYGS